MTELGINRAMPRYRCHKEVWALEIKEVTSNAHAEQHMVFTDESFAPKLVSEGLFARYAPEPGDFYVVYADGYESISPRAAFLDGYVQIEPAGNPG